MYEERRPDSPVVQCIWQARAERDKSYLVPAAEFWDIWFTRESDGEVHAGLSGPQLGHRRIHSRVGQHSWGVQLEAHVILPGVGKALLLGGEQLLGVSRGRITLGGHWLDLPEFGDLMVFVARLLDRGVLRSDDDVRRMLSGDVTYSERHRQRRIRDTTGVTRKKIDQLARARDAFEMLLRGVPPAECAAQCGFTDQAHLTRTLTLFHGQTPARVPSGT